MAYFITRIELHEANSKDYDKLHEEMENKGFSKTIKDKELEYHLPKSEYLYTKRIFSDENKEDYEKILAKAIEAAKKTNKDFSVITSKVSALAFYKLQPV